MFANERRIPFFPELLCVWRLVPDQLEARNPATLLVDGDYRLNLRQISQILDQLPKLLHGANVAPEKNITTRLHLAEDAGRFGVYLKSGYPNQKKLTDATSFHTLPRMLRFLACFTTLFW